MPHHVPSPRGRVSSSVAAVDIVEDGRIGIPEWRLLGFGFAAAVVVYAIPFTRVVFSALVTLFHELGHTIVAWLLGHPALPQFDLVYGGGLTSRGEFKMSIALAIAAGFAWAGWTFRRNRRTLAGLGAVFLVWLLFVSAEWRRELVIATAGHAFEFIIAAILFYQALAGVGWRQPEVERPLGAFAAFFVQIHSILFAMRLRNDPDFLAWYREGKGGMLMNDLESVALDLTIHFGLQPGIEGVALALLLFSIVPVGVALLWFRFRGRCHHILGTLLQTEPA